MCGSRRFNPSLRQNEESEKEAGQGVKEDFRYWVPCHNLLLRNAIMGWEKVGNDLTRVVGKRCTIAGFPIRWEKGNGSIVRLVAILDEDD
jgi:kynurenine formamidase